MSTSDHRPVSPDEEVSPKDTKVRRQSHEDPDSHDTSPSPEPSNDPDSRPTAPVQKRRRVTRACDECRRKKIKCDGKQPCTHCTVYSYECTYDQPSNRRRNPAPQYIEALEQRLQKAEAILRATLPGIDLDDPKFDAHGIEQILESSRGHQAGLSLSQAKSEDDAQMQSMVDQTGSLDLDDTGHWDFHGHSSGYMFMRRFRAKFGDSLIPIPKFPDNKALNHTIESPKSMQSSPFDSNGTLVTDLPPKEIALEYCRAALDDCCALSRPLHRPTFFRRLNMMYEIDAEHWENQQMQFLPLLYIVMALGCLFARRNSEKSLDAQGYKSAIDQGYQWFRASKSLLDITDCRDLISLQAIVFMILFLQGSAKLATCYSYIGVALRACCRLGMHRKVNTNFNAIEQEERKRIFWLVRKLDAYIGSMLGLPQMLSDDDIDQELPTEIHDDYLQEDGILAMPPDIFPLIKATNAHTRLTFILGKVMLYIYPIKASTGSKPGQSYTIGHSRIRELERDLQVWMDQLPMELRPSDNSDEEVSRVQQLLRMAYAYVQMMMYRPFLHYVSPASQSGKSDKRSFACAAACVSVARNIVHITTEMRRRGLLGGAYWFVMYITYFAILSLVYFVLENPDSIATHDILKDAREGRETLASLAKRSFAADRCTASLNGLFEELPEKLKERRSSTQTMPNTSRKRPQPTSDTFKYQGKPGAANMAEIRGTTLGLQDNLFAGLPRARTLPHNYVAKMAKRSSMPTSPATSSSSFNNTHYDNRPSALAGTEFSGSQGGSTPLTNNAEWSTPQMQHAAFPDLKDVMFPSDNPFAYGNQPIITLEDSNFGELQNMAFGPNRYGRTANDTGYTAPNDIVESGQNGLDLGIGNYTSFGSGEAFHQRRPGRNFTESDVARQMNGSAQPASIFGVSDNMIEEPQTMQQNQQPGLMGEDYWTQAPAKAHFRTGLTPGVGGSGVNLNELFGGDSWSSMNMTMDMGTGGDNNTSNTQHGGIDNIWPGTNPSWQ